MPIATDDDKDEIFVDCCVDVVESAAGRSMLDNYGALVSVAFSSLISLFQTINRSLSP